MKKAESLFIVVIVGILLLIPSLVQEIEGFNSYFPRIHDVIIDEALKDLNFSQDALTRVKRVSQYLDLKGTHIRKNGKWFPPNKEYRPEHHFDRNTPATTEESVAAKSEAPFIGGAEYVMREKEWFEGNLTDYNTGEALKALGRALHALQDFYAHSNYVDLATEEQEKAMVAFDDPPTQQPPSSLKLTYYPGYNQTEQPDAYSHEDFCKDNPWANKEARRNVTEDNVYKGMSKYEAAKLGATEYTREFVVVLKNVLAEYWHKISEYKVLRRPVYAPRNITFWTEVSTVKIRPFDSPGKERSIHIKAARNEYDAFQVAVTAPEGLTGVHALVSNLTGVDGTLSNDNIRLYREVYMKVVKPSNIEGKTGLWPDALIPAYDPFFNETRNAFPFDVPVGQNRAIWVDVFVPPTTSAGTYMGNLTIFASGRDPASVPIILTVWDFTLPSTSSLVSAFGFDGWELLVGHYGSHEPDDQIVPLSMLYAESGLMHRISLESVAHEDWSVYPWPPADPINWTGFDANWGPFLDGIDRSYGLKGAKLTSFSLSEWGDTDEERIAYWREYASHFKERGWFDRLFDYTWDEPSDDREFEGIKDRASLIEQADPDLRVLVTINVQEGMEHGLMDVIDIWVPIVNEMHGKTGSDYEGNQRDEYDELLGVGDELWWYQSCMSHGCYSYGTDEDSIGWPSYVIDIPAIYNRIMEWQSFKYNVSGELYFATNYAFQFNDNDRNDPWNTLFYFGGNGDGTLFYPGSPDKIGGTHHIPIESIRLKMIREGMEDYEYMKMLQYLGEESFAKSQVDSVVTNAYTFSHEPAALYSARENMAQRILATSQTGA